MKKDRLRVLYVGPAVAPTGTAVVMRELVNRLDRGRFQPAVIIHRSEGGAEPSEWLNDNVERIDLRGVSPRGRIVRRLWFVTKLQRIISSGGFDCMITDLRSFIYPILAFQKLWGWRIPVIVRWGGIVSAVPKRLRIVEAGLINSLLPAAARIVTPAELGRRDLAQGFGLSPEKVEVIGNFVDPDQLRARASEFDAPRAPGPVVLFVGALSPLKDPWTVLRAFAAVLDEYPQATLRFVGDGLLRRELEQFVQQHGLTDHVIFHGWQSNPYPFFRTADIFVHCSRSDGFAIALLEAAAFHLPIFYAERPVGLLDEMKRVGIGVGFRDEQHLAQRLREHLAAPPLVDGGLYDAFVAMYSPEQFVTAYERVIEDVCG